MTLSALAVFAHSVGTLPNVDAFATAVNSVKNLLGVIGEGTANDSPGSAQSEAARHPPASVRVRGLCGCVIRVSFDSQKPRVG